MQFCIVVVWAKWSYKTSLDPIQKNITKNKVCFGPSIMIKYHKNNHTTNMEADMKKKTFYFVQIETKLSINQLIAQNIYKFNLIMGFY